MRINQWGGIKVAIRESVIIYQDARRYKFFAIVLNRSRQKLKKKDLEQYINRIKR